MSFCVRLCNLAGLITLAAVTILVRPAVGALAADQLLLIANENDPAGVELAEYYARQRNVPDDQILRLDLPLADEIGMDEFEQRIIEPVRAALIQPKFHGKIECIVSFPGVPFRIPPRQKSQELLDELKLLSDHRAKLLAMMAQYADRAEALAREIDSKFVPANGGGEELPFVRLRHASEFSAARLRTVEPENRRAELNDRWESLWQEMQGPVALDDPEPATRQSATLPTYPHSTNLGSVELRRKARANGRRAGAIPYYQIIAIQQQFLSLDQSDASVDSELATVLWGPHVLSRWQGNPLHYRADTSRPTPRTIMTMRLDGPSPQVVRRIIDDSIAAEQNGLEGKAVLDSWAKPEKRPDGTIDGYGRYDQTIRNLERLLTQKSKLPVVFEASDALIAENSQDAIAIYCGWYDPNRVVLPGKFVRGAVGFHIASYTAVGLHATGGGWWTPSLLDAGVAATMGPVSEPYLLAFPGADEFFPLLLTGKLTLAEVYWKTCPLVSWKMLMIGDPLYTPFRKNPALSDADLPEELRSALAGG